MMESWRQHERLTFDYYILNDRYPLRRTTTLTSAEYLTYLEASLMDSTGITPERDFIDTFGTALRTDQVVVCISQRRSQSENVTNISDL